MMLVLLTFLEKPESIVYFHKYVTHKYVTFMSTYFLRLGGCVTVGSSQLSASEGGMKYNNILETIGGTPHVKLHRLFSSEHEVWLKLERANPGGSIKDRIALQMVVDAEERDELRSGSTIIEPTSGNTGIGLAMVGAVKGYRVVLVMPESMSLERRPVMKSYGAELVLTPKEEGMRGAITRATELMESTPKAWMPSQFDNPSNIKAHSEVTAQEILADFPDGFDLMVTGVGTGGHISGCAEVLKEHWPRMEVIAVEPEASPVISGGEPGPHKIQGIGAGFLPTNLIVEYLTGSVSVSDEEAFEFARRAAREEGILVGISSGATLAAIHKTLEEQSKPGLKVIGFCYDTGERYLGVPGLFKAA